MAVVVNNPASESSNSGSNVGLVIVLVMLVLLALIIFSRGIVGFGGASSAPQISVPRQVDVNVNSKK